MTIKKLLYVLVLPLLLFKGQLMAQDRLVTGKVTDGAGAAVANASVVVKGSTTGTQTSAEGNFSLRVPASAKTLTITSVGFSSKDVAIGEGVMNVSLKASNAALSEVVVVGYGTARKKDLTGSVAVVTAKDFQKGNITTPEQLIAGKVAGVSIISNGGQPGSGSQIRIRGGTSFVASNDPLIVVDGVALSSNGIQGALNPLSLINPNDIESFTILKDASSAAIYGSRAANGVIIITTKKGRGGSLRMNFSTTTSIATIAKKLDLLNGDQVRDIVSRLGNATQKSQVGTENTDWQDVIYNSALSTDNNLSVTGGIKSLPYRLNFGYQLQNGILKTDKFQRTSLALNVSPSFLDNHLKIDINLKGTIQKNRLANTGAIGTAAGFDPTQPVHSIDKRYGGYFEWRNANGSLYSIGGAANPLGMLEQTRNDQSPQRSIGNIQFDYKFHFLPDLRANLNLGYDVSKNMGHIVVSDSSASAYTSGGSIRDEKQTQKNTLLETYLSYAKEISSKSHVDILAGYSYNNFQIKSYDIYPTLNFKGDSLSKPSNIIYNSENTILSFFSRLNFSYNDKYLLTATLRRDGSSRFSKDNRWGTFPAASVAWRIKNESFMKENRLISDLKLRVGYGVTGQQEGIGNYEYIPFYYYGGATETYYVGGDSVTNTLSPAAYNTALKWEETKTYNTAIDFALANGRISGTLEFYLKKTSDLINRVPVAAGSTFGLYQNYNIGSLENKGVEFSLNVQPIRNKITTLDVSYNIGYNKNTLTQLSNQASYKGLETSNIEGASGFIFLNAVGGPRNTFYVFHQVYDVNGKPIEGLLDDANRDGIYNDNDRYLSHSSDPNLFMGFSTNLSHKKWNFGFVMRASFNNYLYNNVYSNRGRLSQVLGDYTTGNASVNYLETGFTGKINQEFQPKSDYYLENASFLKMDNFNLGYSFGKIMKGSATLRANAFVQNVFVITKYKGLDPENSSGIDNTLYPRPRIYSLGLNLDF